MSNKRYYRDYYLKHRAKALKQAHKRYVKNKIHLKEVHYKWNKDNKEHKKFLMKRQYENNKVKWRADSLRFRENHPKYMTDYFKNRRLKDINFKLSCYLRTRISSSIRKGYKSSHTMKLIGCTINFLKGHLENQFKTGMTWDNYGKWHVDHIVPCCKFDLTKSRNQRKCFNYKNLQPLWAHDNIVKGGR
jgi:hypothetical protein